MPEASYNKLQPRKTGPFRIIEVQWHTVGVDEYVVTNTSSIHQKTAALGRATEATHRYPDMLDRVIHRR